MNLNPIRLYYQTLLDALGPSGWWPAQSAFEVAVGAVLTQNTAWRNVEKALAALKAADAFSVSAMLALPIEDLAELIRPSGYYRLKAARLRNLLDFLAREAAGDPSLADDPALSYLSGQDTRELREKLLAVRGVGPETADCILLYALDRPVFVVDAYTARVAVRHGLASEDAGYDELQDIFSRALPEDAAVYNECHALLVRVGHALCKKSRPLCNACPLGTFLETRP